MEYLERLHSAMLRENLPAEYIELCCNYAKDLLAKGLPVIFDKQHLYQMLNMIHPAAFELSSGYGQY